MSDQKKKKKTIACPPLYTHTHTHTKAHLDADRDSDGCFGALIDTLHPLKEGGLSTLASNLQSRILFFCFLR